MSEPFLGEIRLFPYNFAPRGWAFCNGQVLSIAQNTALFALIGTTYGGDGQTTFALPDLRGRMAVSAGQGPGLSDYQLGQAGGTETVTLSESQMPAHNHQVAVNGRGSAAQTPNGTFLGRNETGNSYAARTNGKFLNPASVVSAGGSQPHENMPPHLTLNYCIALQGIFPSRN